MLETRSSGRGRACWFYLGVRTLSAAVLKPQFQQQDFHEPRAFLSCYLIPLSTHSSLMKGGGFGYTDGIIFPAIIVESVIICFLNLFLNYDPERHVTFFFFLIITILVSHRPTEKYVTLDLLCSRWVRL